MLQIKLSSRVCVVNLRPQICYLLSLLRIHSPDCKHCMAQLTCGNELRRRLEELNGNAEPVQFQSLSNGVEIALMVLPSMEADRRKGQ